MAYVRNIRYVIPLVDRQAVLSVSPQRFLQTPSSGSHDQQRFKEDNRHYDEMLQQTGGDIKEKQETPGEAAKRMETKMWEEQVKRDAWRERGDKLAKNIKEKGDPMVEQGKEMAKKAGETIKDTAEKAQEAVKQASDRIMGKSEETVQKIKGQGEEKSGPSISGQYQEKIQEQQEKLKEKAHKMTDSLKHVGEILGGKLNQGAKKLGLKKK